MRVHIRASSIPLRNASALILRVRYLTLLGIALFLVSCLGEKAPHAPTTNVDRIFIVTVDTLRADHCGAYGYPIPTTPFLDRMATEGTTFVRAFAPMATTAPSHATIFTGLYPLQHGIEKNGHRMDSSVQTLAEQLSEQGYETAGFVSTNRHFVTSNIDQGFAHFDEPSFDDPSYRKADQTVARAIAWLKRKKVDERLFVWVHLFDPHTPYHTEDYFPDPLPEPSAAERRKIASFLLKEHHVSFKMFRNNEDTLTAHMRQYDNEVLFADQQLRALFASSEERGLNERSLWVFTADHGEGLGNHRWFDHGKNIYNEQIRVPLIFRLSPAVDAGTRVEAVVEHTDIFPTVLDIAGFSTANEQGDGARTGTSLAPLIQGHAEQFPEKDAFAQRRAFKARENPTLNYEPGEKYALQNRTFKYIHRTKGGDMLFRIEDDPYETRNILASSPEVGTRMREKILSTLEELRAEGSAERETVDPESIKRLKAIGYIQ